MSADQKHFDVTPLRDRTPQHTSRPIIVGTNSEGPDPMVRPADESRPEAILHHEAPAFDLSHKNTIEAAQKYEEPESITEPTIASEPSLKNQNSESTDKIVNELIEKKTYQLPIHNNNSAQKLFIIVVIIFGLVAGGLYFALVATNTL